MYGDRFLKCSLSLSLACQNTYHTYAMSTVARTLKYAVLGTGRMVSLPFPIL